MIWHRGNDNGMKLKTNKSRITDLPRLSFDLDLDRWWHEQAQRRRPENGPPTKGNEMQTKTLGATRPSAPSIEGGPLWRRRRIRRRRPADGLRSSPASGIKVAFRRFLACRRTEHSEQHDRSARHSTTGSVRLPRTNRRRRPTDHPSSRHLHRDAVSDLTTTLQ